MQEVSARSVQCQSQRRRIPLPRMIGPSLDPSRGALVSGSRSSLRRSARRSLATSRSAALSSALPGLKRPTGNDGALVETPADPRTVSAAGRRRARSSVARSELPQWRGHGERHTGRPVVLPNRAGAGPLRRSRADLEMPLHGQHQRTRTITGCTAGGARVDHTRAPDEFTRVLSRLRSAISGGSLETSRSLLERPKGYELLRMLPMWSCCAGRESPPISILARILARDASTLSPEPNYTYATQM